MTTDAKLTGKVWLAEDGCAPRSVTGADTLGAGLGSPGCQTGSFTELLQAVSEASATAKPSH
ncbi:hypothetical protein AwPolaro_05210 [Polaromonas sp.]|nr:hypothetical protein AwPolaro_05210 [Polaromonas sp.]